MIGMLAALGYAAVAFVRGADDRPPKPRRAWLTYATPALVVIGLAVAAYLSYVETQSVRAICGPVGDDPICTTAASEGRMRVTLLP